MVRPCERKTEDVMRTWKMEVGGHRQIGRPKLRRSDVIRKYMKEKVLGTERRTTRPENVEIEEEV